MPTHSLLLQILAEAEACRDDTTLPQDARDRSAETGSLCCLRLVKEGLHAASLKRSPPAARDTFQGTILRKFIRKKKSPWPRYAA